MAFVVAVIASLVSSAIFAAVIWSSAAVWRFPLRYPNIRGQFTVTATFDTAVIVEEATINRQLGRRFRGELRTPVAGGVSLILDLRGEFHDRTLITYQHTQRKPTGEIEFGVGIVRLANNLTSGRGRSLNVGTVPDQPIGQSLPLLFEVEITRVK